MNCTSDRGGAISIVEGRLQLRDMTFVGNSAQLSGGAVYSIATLGLMDIQVSRSPTLAYLRGGYLCGHPTTRSKPVYVEM